MEKKNPLVFTLFNQIVSLSPLILAAFYFFDDYNKFPPFRELISNGELLIICIPTIALIILNLYFYKRKWNIWITAFLFIPNILIMIYSVGLFSKRFKFGTSINDSEPSDLLIWSSIIIVITTTLSLFFTYLVENSTIEPNVSNNRAADGETLGEKVKKARS